MKCGECRAESVKCGVWCGAWWLVGGAWCETEEGGVESVECEERARA